MEEYDGPLIKPSTSGIEPTEPETTNKSTEEESALTETTNSDEQTSLQTEGDKQDTGFKKMVGAMAKMVGIDYEESKPTEDIPSSADIKDDFVMIENAEEINNEETDNTYTNIGEKATQHSIKLVTHNLSSQTAITFDELINHHEESKKKEKIKKDEEEQEEITSISTSNRVGPNMHLATMLLEEIRQEAGDSDDDTDEEETDEIDEERERSIQKVVEEYKAKQSLKLTEDIESSKDVKEYQKDYEENEDEKPSNLSENLNLEQPKDYEENKDERPLKLNEDLNLEELKDYVENEAKQSFNLTDYLNLEKPKHTEEHKDKQALNVIEDNNHEEDTEMNEGVKEEREDYETSDEEIAANDVKIHQISVGNVEEGSKEKSDYDIREEQLQLVRNLMEKSKNRLSPPTENTEIVNNKEQISEESEHLQYVSLVNSKATEDIEKLDKTNINEINEAKNENTLLENTENVVKQDHIPDKNYDVVKERNNENIVFRDEDKGDKLIENRKQFVNEIGEAKDATEDLAVTEDAKQVVESEKEAKMEPHTDYIVIEDTKQVVESNGELKMTHKDHAVIEDAKIVVESVEEAKITVTEETKEVIESDGEDKMVHKDRALIIEDAKQVKESDIAHTGPAVTEDIENIDQTAEPPETKESDYDQIVVDDEDGDLHYQDALDTLDDDGSSKAALSSDNDRATLTDDRKFEQTAGNNIMTKSKLKTSDGDVLDPIPSTSKVSNLSRAEIQEILRTEIAKLTKDASIQDIIGENVKVKKVSCFEFGFGLIDELWTLLSNCS